MVVVIICIKTSKLAAVLLPGVLPAAVETLRLGSGRSVPAGAAHGAAAAPGSPSLQTTRSPSVPSYTRQAASLHCALSIQVS